MKLIRLLSITVGFALLSAIPAHADITETQAINAISAALGAREKAILDVSGNDSRTAAQWALNTVVSEGIRALRNGGETKLADRYENEWNGSFVMSLTEFGILGDHKPLLQWLANFYDKIEERLGTAVIHNGLLGDIYLMNFAIPIVFTPKGDWRTTTTPNRDWVEYRKHFIPFANVVTYWGSKIACNKIMKKQGGGKQGQKMCEKVATKLRFVMGRHIAPKISDFIFKKANGERATLDITPTDLKYVSAQELLTELNLEEGGIL